MSSLKSFQSAKNEYLMQTWQMLLGEHELPANRRSAGVKNTAVGFVKWLVCVPEIFRLVPVFCGKTRHEAVFVGELTNIYPEYPIWLRKCWGIAVMLIVPGNADGAYIKEKLCSDRFDTLLLSDDRGMTEKIARENGLNVIYIEQNRARSKYLMRRDMRKSVNNFMTIVLGEKPIKAEYINKDTI